MLVVETASLELVHEPRPKEREIHRRVLEGIVEILQDSSISEDALSRLAPRHLAMPQVTVGANGMNLNRYCRALKIFAEDPKGFYVHVGVYATVLCDMHCAYLAFHRRRLCSDEQSR